jgi:hypothetical protein
MISAGRRQFDKPFDQMKKTILFLPVRLAAKLLVCVLSILLAGCAGEKPVSQRGWIGGEYALARPATFLTAMSHSPGVVGDFPGSLRHTQKAAILVTKLDTNAPALSAGLRKGDLVLELNHHPVTRLQNFRRIIDQSGPGTRLAVKAWRDGQMVEYSVPVGREKFRKGGSLSFAFPTVVHPWDLWPDPGFSLVVLGYEPNPGVRRELGNNRETFDEEWKAYLVFFELSVGKRILSQEPVVAGTGVEAAGQ